MSKKAFIKGGQSNAITLFQQAAQRVPAYKDFLHRYGVNPSSIKSIADFTKLPSMTKENYIDKYPLVSRIWDGNLSGMHMISTSSGTTGLPYFWPRDLKTEIDGAYLHEILLKELFHIDKTSTLFINGFALGNWIAGTFTSACINFLSWKYPLLSLMTPGYSLESILELLKKIAPSFEQVIITGHTPFLKELIDVSEAQKIDFSKMHVSLFGTGQAITENWRSYMLKKLYTKDAYRVINLYGSADAGLMGFETPFSIALRKHIGTNSALQQKIFHDIRLPSLYAYDPRIMFFESEKNELHITKHSGVPLIRYNMRDTGGILTSGEIAISLNKEKRELQNFWEIFPLVYLYGREKFMVKIFGANVYTEHVQQAMVHESIQEKITGRFLMELTNDDDHNPKLLCRVELHNGIDKDDDFEKLVEDIFVETVTKLNSEYKDAYSRMGAKVRPKIVLHKHGDPDFFPVGKMKKTA